MPGRPDCGTHRLPASPELQLPEVQTSGIPASPGLPDSQAPSITGIAIAGSPNVRDPSIQPELPDVRIAGLPGSQHHRNCNCRTSGLPDSQAPSITGIAIAGSPNVQAPSITGIAIAGGSRLPASPELQLPDVHPSITGIAIAGSPIAGLPGSQHHRNCNCRTSIMLNVQAHGMTGIAIAKLCQTPGLTA